jgi:hypothetical protein
MASFFYDIKTEVLLFSNFIQTQNKIMVMKINDMGVVSGYHKNIARQLIKRERRLILRQ